MARRSRRRKDPTYFIWHLEGTTEVTGVYDDYYTGFVVVAQNEERARNIIRTDDYYGAGSESGKFPDYWTNEGHSTCVMIGVSLEKDEDVILYNQRQF